MPAPSLVATLATPGNTAGAIACVQIRAHTAADLDAFITSVSLDRPASLSLGVPKLRDLLGIDDGLALRWDPTTLDLFPHGGIAIVRWLMHALEQRGVARSDRYRYPEADDEIEQRMLAALAMAPSPLAVDLLLSQPGRWRAHKESQPLADERVLNRLVHPPLVAAVGPPNIGKSTLLNALAGRSVAIVADEPGTTRDHVGATLDLGGLVVRYLDTPGRLPDAAGADADAIALADSATAHADLVLSMGDPSTPPLDAGELPIAPDASGQLATGAHPSVLRVCLRRDLGEPSWEADLEVSSMDRTGLDGLVRTIRELLVPRASIDHPGPWRFWVADAAPELP